MDLQGRRILVVGGAGLIGSHIVDLLTKEDVREIVIFDNFVRGTHANLKEALRDPRVCVIEGDIRNCDEIERAAKGKDGVFLLAALWLLQCAQDPRAAVHVNIEGNFNVLEACRQAGVQRLVFSSSASVYGNALVAPMIEEHPLNNRTFYGATKVALEQMLRAYHEMYRLNYVGLRYFNVYGPRQDYNNAYVSVIMKVLDRIERHERPIIFGDGSQAYDFIYVKDIARANLLAMQSQVADESFNICTGVKTSIKELVEVLLEITGSPLEPEYQPASHVFVTDRLGSPEKARRVLGFVAETPLRQGLEEVVAWRSERFEAQSV